MSTTALRNPMPCRFGASCHRPDCYYTHPEGRAPVKASPTPATQDAKTTPTPLPCRFGATCHRPDCYYSHPEGRVATTTPQPSARAAPANPSSTGAAPSEGSAPVACIYGSTCRDPARCRFAHPPGAPSVTDQLLVNARQLAGLTKTNVALLSQGGANLEQVSANLRQISNLCEEALRLRRA